MRFLIDTCLFLWTVEGSDSVPSSVRALMMDPENAVFLSAVSAWEILLKNEVGKLPLSRPADEFVTHFRDVHGIEALPLTEPDVHHLARLPRIHHDPFDRMLVCQAIANGLVILTPDPAIRQYPVRTLW